MFPKEKVNLNLFDGKKDHLCAVIFSPLKKKNYLIAFTFFSFLLNIVLFAFLGHLNGIVKLLYMLKPMKQVVN